MTTDDDRVPSLPEPHKICKCAESPESTLELSESGRTVLNRISITPYEGRFESRKGITGLCHVPDVVDELLWIICEGDLPPQRHTSIFDVGQYATRANWAY